MNHNARKSFAAWLSVISNFLLVIFKLIIGLMINSVSVISEAIHSGVDLLAAVIALFAVKTAGKPADEEHPFGHNKIENISGTIEALLIFIAAGWIIYEAVHKLQVGAPIEEFSWGVLIMAFSALANWFVSKYLFKVGKETDSVALRADAWHLRTDVYTSLGVMLGLAIMWGGRFLFPNINLYWIDPIVAILVAMMILQAAWHLTLEAGRDLLDSSLPSNEVQWIIDLLKSVKGKIKGYHKLRTRKSGSQRFIEFHLLVDADMSVKDAHDISDEITKWIKQKYENSYVSIHIEPCDKSCKPHCLQGCMSNPD